MNSSKLLLMLKKNLFLILLIILAIIPRFALLDKVPNALNEDELHYVIDSKSFYLTGKDVYGEVTPLDILLFHSPKSEPLQAELQYFIETPVVGLFGFSLITIVFSNAILSVLIVLLIYLITLKLFNKNAALFAAFIAAINPWFIFLGRTIYEAGPATLFFLCIFYVLLVAKGRKILLAIPFALLAFYSYIGTKLIFIPFMILGIGYAYLYVNKRKYTKQYFLLFAFACILTLFFIFQFKQYQVSRTAEIILPNNPEITRQVIGFRKVAIQSPFIDIFDNKISVYLTVLMKNTFNAFSPNYLFGNADYFFMLGGHGLFYYLDSIFLVIGSVWLFLKNRKLFFTFLSIIFIGALPQILHDPDGSGNFTPHIALVIPFFVILIGAGIDWLFGAVKQKKYSFPLLSVIVGLYLVAFMSFSYFYFFKFPLQTGTFPIKYRLLSKYISLYNDQKTPIIVYSTNSKLAYREYIFYTNAYKNYPASKINSSFKTLKLDNVSFLSCSEIFPKGVLLINDYNCGKQPGKGSIIIAQLVDSGPSYNIYNDKICSKYGLPHYITNIKLSDFNVESLSEEEYCKTFIVSY